MPTPFYHLSIAEDLLANRELPERVRSFLNSQRAAFLLGNIAPDVQTISGQMRQETHFFCVPQPVGVPLPWQQLQRQYPFTSHPHSLIAEQEAFWAGYMCHLQADWYWVADIYLPAYGPACGWGTPLRRQVLHDVLRVYLDRQILSGLPDNIASQLDSVNPEGWLPFVPEPALLTWRDDLADQLRPGATVYTLEVFAARAGVSQQTFKNLLDAESEMDRRVFSHTP